jgi:hypothetical protein
MKIIVSVLSGWLFVVGALTCQSVSAAVVFNNRGDLKGGTEVVDGGGTNGWWGQAFSTTASATIVTDVVLSMSNGNAGTAFSVGIYSSVAGSGLNVPGSLTQSIFTGTPGQFFSPFSITGLNVPLSPSTEYFVVVSPTVGALDWDFTNASSSLNANSVDQGGTWSSTTSAPLQMSITAVPEPATLSLLAAAGLFGGLAVVRRRS